MSMVLAGVLTGRPACSHALRAMFCDCSPTWVTQPPITFSTSSGAMPARSTTAP